MRYLSHKESRQFVNAFLKGELHGPQQKRKTAIQFRQRLELSYGLLHAEPLNLVSRTAELF